MEDQRQIMYLLDEAAVMISLLEPAVRGRWISHFFEALEAEVDEEILRTAQDILTERLLIGSW